MVEPLRQVTRMWPTDGSDPLPCTLYYDPRDPYVVTVEMWCPERRTWVTWDVGRDLLAAGLERLAGTPDAGDVLVWPDGHRIGIEMRGELEDGSEATTQLSTSRAPVAVFLRLTHGMVPAGDEHLWLDLDDVAARLLAGDGQC